MLFNQPYFSVIGKIVIKNTMNADREQNLYLVEQLTQSENYIIM